LNLATMRGRRVRRRLTIVVTPVPSATPTPVEPTLRGSLAES